MIRIGFAFLSLLFLFIALVVANYAFNLKPTWGYDPSADYVTFINGNKVQESPQSGERIISTNNGALGLLIPPFAVNGIIFLLGAFTGKLYEPMKNICTSIWYGVFIAFPIYALVFVNLLYDSMHYTQAANPALVMILPVSGGLIVFISRMIYQKYSRPGWRY
jgi:hypothetical protein